MNLREKLADQLIDIRKLNEQDELSDSDKIILDSKLSEAKATRKAIEREDELCGLDGFAKPGIDPEAARRSAELRAGYTPEPQRVGRGDIIGDSGTVTTTVGQDRSYRGMFPELKADNYGWASMGEFVNKVGHAIPDARLERSLVEGVPSDGGFLIPQEYARDVFDIALASEIVRPRAQVYGMRSETLNIPAVCNSDNSSGLYGVDIGWTEEGGSITESNPTFRSMKLQAKKCTSFFKMSNEFLNDSKGGKSAVSGIMSNALAWELDKQLLTGDGAGKPLGVSQANCLIVVDKEAGQDADTVVYENVVNMWSRLHSGSHSKAVWVCSPNVLPQLMTMGITVGTGGGAVFVAGGTAANAPYTSLLGRPLLVSEHMSTLGDEFDIALVDLSMYAVGLRSEISLASSIHVSFQTDEIALRGICRIDGQPLWESALTLSDGSQTCSPFVTLQERT